MADLRELKDRAAELAAKGKLERAAGVYREVLAADPRDVATLQKLAEVLRRAGDLRPAIEAYRQVAERFGRDGLLIKAIAICKTILELDPEHAATQAALAELYAHRAGAAPRGAGRAAAPAARRAEASTPAPLGQNAATPLAQIVSAARTAIDDGLEEDVILEVEPLDEPTNSTSTSTPTPTSTPTSTSPATARSAAKRPPAILVDPVPEPDAAASLERVPIFSDLSREAFLALAAGLTLRRFDRGAAVLREGEEGKSFFVVASGKLAVSKRDEAGEHVVLARLGEGEFFGEMALLSGAPRSATVTAEEPSEVLELDAELLLGLARRHPHLAQSLQRFYRQRLLANALAASPVFRPFGRGDRRLIMEKFRAREVRPNDVIVREGEPSDGFYVILEGAVEVVKRAGARDQVVGLLREGDLFGEVSCLRKTPATATVVVRRAGTLLRLPRTAFDELVVTYPQILELVSELSDERLENLDAILSGHAQWTDEGLVLV